MKIIFALLPEKGHINPFIGPAQALRDLGHTVGVVSIGPIGEQIEAAGLTFHPDLLGSPQDAPPQGKAMIEIMLNKKMQMEMINRWFVEAAAAHVAGHEIFYGQEQPDLLVIDPMNYGAILAAERKKIPWVGMSSSLSAVLPDGLQSDVLTMIEVLKPQREDLFRRHGVQASFRAIDCLSPLLNVTFATKELVGGAPTEIHLLGPSQPLRARGDEMPSLPISTQRPVVYASFGSQVYYLPDVFKKIVEATQLAGVFAILSIGDLMKEPEWQNVPSHCQFYQYAPQRHILNRAHGFITHGGANSVMEGIVAGVPLLVSPICNDQAHQAHLVKQAGIGEVLDLQQASVAQIKEAIQLLLESPDIRRCMRKVSDSYQTNGAVRAAHMIESALRR